MHTNSVPSQSVFKKLLCYLLTSARVIIARLTPSAILSIVIALLILLPLITIVSNSAQVSGAKWSDIFSNSIPTLLGNTLKLAVLVAIITSVIGVSTAWLVTRYQFRGSSLIVWLLILPLAIPTYVYAEIYVYLFSDEGWFASFGQFWFNDVMSSDWMKAMASVWGSVTGDQTGLIQFSNLIATSIVLSLATFPYVFLLVRTALSKSTQSLEDVAKLHGLNARQRFWRVNFPLLRPALAASLAIVVLHTISDFGAVSVMEFPTFTWEIYIKSKYANTNNDFGPAAVLSVVLIVLAFTFLMLERFFRRRQKFFAKDSVQVEPEKKALSRGQLVSVWFWLGLVLFFAIGLPLLWLIVYSWEAYSLGKITADFWAVTFNSFWVAFVVAAIALVMALPIALFNYRRQSPVSQMCSFSSNVGFILPGPVVIIGILLLFHIFIHEFGTLEFMAAWIVAVVIRYMPLAVQTQESTLQQITPSIEQAGRMLGLNAWQTLHRILLPIMKNGMASAWVLVFIDALKELPIALTVNVVGMKTLPILIWSEADDETLVVAAPAALMLVLVTLPALWLMMRNKK